MGVRLEQSSSQWYFISHKYKMWGNGIALPCAMFVMEGIAMILNEEDADEQK